MYYIYIFSHCTNTQAIRIAHFEFGDQRAAARQSRQFLNNALYTSQVHIGSALSLISSFFTKMLTHFARMFIILAGRFFFCYLTHIYTPMGFFFCCVCLYFGTGYWQKTRRTFAFFPAERRRGFTVRVIWAKRPAGPHACANHRIYNLISKFRLMLQRSWVENHIHFPTKK